jgi:hypothetical protein
MGDADGLSPAASGEETSGRGCGGGALLWGLERTPPRVSTSKRLEHPPSRIATPPQYPCALTRDNSGRHGSHGHVSSRNCQKVCLGWVVTTCECSWFVYPYVTTSLLINLFLHCTSNLALWGVHFGGRAHFVGALCTRMVSRTADQAHVCSPTVALSQW